MIFYLSCYHIYQGVIVIMAKVVYGPMRATFTHCPDDSKVKYAEGKTGILEILESQNRNPGNHFAIFYFSSVRDNPFEGDEYFMTDRYIKTSICELDVENHFYTFNKGEGDAFIFKEIDGFVIEDLRFLN